MKLGTINMKSWVVFATLTLLITLSTNAQKSPEILPDGRVTFRCKAGNATEVKAQGQFGAAVVLKKGEKDVWEGTSEQPMKPGVYEYSLSVDGRRMIDGRNSMIKPQRWPGSSILHIPANPPALWDLQDIPHGTVHRHDYFSKSLNKWRKLVVYTPPQDLMAGSLPVLYLAHGFSDNQNTWSVHGKAHWILDALIHAGKAKPMIVVMPDAHAIAPPDIKKYDSYGPDNTQGFCDDVIKDVIPFIEKSYNVKKDAKNRAFAGLSMGGGHALNIALKHSNLFSQVGAFSSAPPKDDTVAIAGQKSSEINNNLKVFWIACGDKDFLYERNGSMHAELKKLGINHDYYITPGDTHAWPVWRRYLAEFAPKLFK